MKRDLGIAASLAVKRRRCKKETLTFGEGLVVPEKDGKFAKNA